MINVEKLLFLTRKVDENANIDNINDGILFADSVKDEDKTLLIKTITEGKEESTLVYFFVKEKPTIRKYKKQFWLDRMKIKHFSEDLITIFSITDDELLELREDIFRKLNTAYSMWINKDEEGKKEEPEEILSLEEENQINDLLNNPEMFKILQEKMSLWCQGNDLQKIFLYVISYSTYLKEPDLVGIIGNSSSGKSHLVKSVMKLFKSGKWEKLASSSSKGFYYSDMDWEGKRLFLLEVQGLNDENMVLLRTWWSEGGDMNLSHLTVDKNQAGQMVGSKKILKKPPFGIFTSAAPEVENQLSTRIWRIHADDSEDQHKCIKKMISDNAIFDIDKDLDKGIPLKIFQHIEDYINTNVQVIIPYAHNINLKSYRESRVNRDVKKMFNAIKCFTILSQRRRLMFDVGNTTYILSEIEDYINFLKYGGLIFSNTVKDIDDEMRRCINSFVSGVGRGKTTYNISEIADEIKISDRSKVKRILDELYNKNILERYKGNRNAWEYTMTPEAVTSFNSALYTVTGEVNTDIPPSELQNTVLKLKEIISSHLKDGDNEVQLQKPYNWITTEKMPQNSSDIDYNKDNFSCTSCKGSILGKKLFDGGLDDLKKIINNFFTFSFSVTTDTTEKKADKIEIGGQELKSK